MQRFFLCLCVLFGMTAAEPALAGRTLTEPGPVKAVPRMVPSAKQSAALTTRGAVETCTADVLKSRELNGLGCRLAVHGQLATEQPLGAVPDVTTLTTAAKDALTAADSIATYEPLTAKPNLAKHRLFAHEQACRTALEVHDVLKGAAKDATPVGAAAKASMGSASDGLFKKACECAQTTVGLGSAAGVSVEETGRLQAQVTSRGCFLDKSKVAANRGGPESEFSGRAVQVAEANTDEARLLEYAKARDLGLDRCRSKNAPSGVVNDKLGLKKCACGEIERYSFPKERGRPDVDIVVPILERRVGVRVTVTAPGKVKACGPLEGPGA